MTPTDGSLAPLAAGSKELPSPLHAQALARPRHVALREGTRALTYVAWAHAVDERASELAACGVRQGERVAVVGQAGLVLAIELFALRALGAVPAPLPLEMLELMPRLAALAPAWLQLLADVTLPATSGAMPPLLPRPSPLSPPPGARRAAPKAWSLEEPWFVLTTSGSTGTPQAISLSGLQMFTSTFGVASRLGHLPQDTWLACLPWHHIGGLMVLLRTVLLGCQAIVEAPFAAAPVAALLDGGAISLAALVPTMLAKVLAVRKPTPFPARLRAIVIGGARAPAALVAEAQRLAVPIALSWGMTEASSQLATRFVYSEGEMGDVGPPLSVVAIGTDEGRLLARGPLVDGERLTSDRGKVRADGRVEVFGRAVDVFISGGENVPVEPIEAVLLQHPAIVDAAVAPEADPLWGERPRAHLVLGGPAGQLAPSERPSDAALLAFCRSRLLSWQCPATFVWHAQLPRDGLGKLRRRSLRSTGEETKC